MKTIKYLVMGVLLAGFSATANAQEAELEAALAGIKSKAPNVAELAKTAYKKNKKNADALIKVARAFYEQKDTANANLFANYANEAGKPKYQYAPAYLLLGDVEASYGTDGGKAAGYYNQAINFDPKNPEGYKKWAMVYRKISPSQAAKKLQDMKANCPDEDVDAITGHIYLKAAEAGLKLEPRNPTFTRLAMFSNYELKKYDDAKAYIHKYFNETDSAKFSEYDHFYTALIYQALEDKENMYAQYDKALELVNDSSMIKRHAILKSVSDSYLADKNFDNAIKYYQDFLGCKPELNSDDMEGLAKIYSKYADEDEVRKAELVGKAIEAYRAMGEKFPIQNIYAAYQCATMNNKLDKTGEKGLAKPDYQRVVELLESKADRNNSENTMLKYSYHYLMSNAFLYGKNKPLAKEYANKILAIDPEYAPAQQIRDLK